MTNNMTTMIVIASIIGVACIVFGIFLLVAKHETLKSNRWLNGGVSRGGALVIYRFTGVQMIILGVLLLLCMLCLWLNFVWPAMILLVAIFVLPLACSSYRKRSKRFK
ncbi:MAG: hypothetical protein LBV27_10080 [Oscillospiraceae bacterium]|jgi:uncharacterized membrane protein HdeD (DUF308 family)|nr:hypothetical protein [Oscillospiraceae bacterium]